MATQYEHSEEGDEAMADENIDGAVKYLMKRLMESTAKNFDLAFARYETSELEAALAQARRLMESEDAAERELGERLKAEILDQQRRPGPPGLVLDVTGGNGVAHDPLSPSPSPSLPAAATPSPAPEQESTATPSGRSPKSLAGPDPQAQAQPQPSQPPKRGRGRPPKNPPTSADSG